MSEKLGYLNEQTTELEGDFEKMREARERAKQQLEARFNEILRKIQNSKDFITSQGQRINQNLIAYQHKFDHKVKEITDENEAEFKAIQTTMKENFDQFQVQIDSIRAALEQEKEDKVQEGKDYLQNLYGEIQILNQMLVKEKMSRLEKEQEINHILQEDYVHLTNELNTEIDEMKENQQKLNTVFDEEMQKQNEITKEFVETSIKEFRFITENCQLEIDQRLSHQDNIVENLKKTISTIQNTLKEIVKQ